MKNYFKYLKSKRFLLLLVFVMLLNVTLTVVLLRASFGQTQRDDYSKQQLVNVEVGKQKGCPLRIMVINVDNSGLSFQNIAYSLQNISGKAIRAYTVLGDGKSNGKVVTRFYTTDLLQSGKYEFNDFPVERATIQEDEEIALSVDYVKFADGSSWGTDSQKKSKELDGQGEGVKFAISQIKNLIKGQDRKTANDVESLLNQDIRDISIEAPDTTQSEEWKQGFRRGYKAVVSVLQDEREQKTENLIKKLDEMEKLSRKEVKIQ